MSIKDNDIVFLGLEFRNKGTKAELHLGQQHVEPWFEKGEDLLNF